jgi:GTPase involved in cell partitioning and DNA repair
VAESVNASSGQPNGSINFKMKDLSPLSDQFIIFDLTAIRNGATDKVKINGRFLEHLAAGKYEFLVVDKKREKCIKEILVEIKEL